MNLQTVLSHLPDEELDRMLMLDAVNLENASKALRLTLRVDAGFHAVAVCRNIDRLNQKLQAVQTERRRRQEEEDAR